MSDTDSFIDEVTEEVRRDRLFKLMRRYAWIAVLVVLALVGGTAWNEWKKSTERAAAEGYGDAMLTALEKSDSAERVAAFDGISVPNTESRAVMDLLAASEEQKNDPTAATERLLALSKMDGIDPIYKQIATLRAAAISEGGLSVEERRAALDGLTLGQGLMRLLAMEQIAYIDIETGDTNAAIEGFETILSDEDASGGLRSRAAQMIVALGGTLPDEAAAN